MKLDRKRKEATNVNAAATLFGLAPTLEHRSIMLGRLIADIVSSVDSVQSALRGWEPQQISVCGAKNIPARESAAGAAVSI